VEDGRIGEDAVEELDALGPSLGRQRNRQEPKGPVLLHLPAVLIEMRLGREFRDGHGPSSMGPVLFALAATVAATDGARPKSG
jgi:hypothetical protein